MNKVKVLFLAANPIDTDRLRLDEEIREIGEKIRASEHRDIVELVYVWAVRADDMLQSLNEHKPHIVHFSGHGSQLGETVLIDNNGASKPVSTRAIRALFRTLKDNVRVVVLNACYRCRLIHRIWTGKELLLFRVPPLALTPPILRGRRSQTELGLSAKQCL